MFESFKAASYPSLLPVMGAVLGAATLAVVLHGQVSAEAARVRMHTEDMARHALASAGHAWARFEIHDEVGRLVGQAPDPSSRDAAWRIARQAMAPAMAWPGVFNILQDATHLAAPMAQVAPRVPLMPSLRPQLKPALSLAEQCRTRVDEALGGERILFELGSSRLTAGSRRRLAAVADVARECPAARLAVHGHTDASGQPALNQRLSQLRAEAVVAALVQAGVPAERLAPQGLGASRPLAQGNDPATRALNRRIEFHWLA